MTLSLIISIVCFSLLVLVFTTRFFEVAKNKFIISEKKRFVLDHRISKIILAVIKNIARMKKFFKNHKTLLPKRVIRIVHVMWSKLRDRIDKFFEKMHRMHRKDIKSNIDNNKGAVSMYWKSVSEHINKK